MPYYGMTRLLLPLALLTVLAACGGDKEAESTPTRDPIVDTTPEPFPTSMARFSDALLVPEDLGEGWTADRIEDATAADQYFCGVKADRLPFSAGVNFRNALAERAYMGEIISHFDTEALAQKAMEENRQLHKSCTEWLSTDGVNRTEWRTESFEDVDLGEDSTIEHASTQFPGAPDRSNAMVVTIRERDTLILIVDIYLREADRAETLEIARMALEKIRVTTGR